MKKYMLLAIVMVFPGIAHAGNTRIVVPFTGTFGSSAFGDYKPGDKISGTVSYERIFNSYGDGYFDGQNTISIGKGSDKGSDMSVLYTTGNTNLGTFSFSTGRSLPIYTVSFTGVRSDRNYLPTLAQIMGAVGSFNILDYNYDEATDNLYETGGSGTIQVGGVADTSPIAAPVPEPATWASMFAGLGLAAGAARYKRRKTKVIFA